MYKSINLLMFYQFKMYHPLSITINFLNSAPIKK